MRQTNTHLGITDLWKDKTEAQRAALNRQGRNRYKVRYVKPDGSEGAARFQKLQQAQAFQKSQKRSPEEVVSQAAKTATVREVMNRWLATKADRERSTLLAYQQDVAGVVEAFGDALASEVDEYEVEVWSVRETPGSSKRRKQIVAMKAAFKMATKGKNHLLAANQLADVPLPTSTAKDPQYLDWDQLEDLADEMEEYAPLIWVLGTCGIRLEEAARLNVEDIDRHKRTLFIRKSKTTAGRNRWVPVDNEVLAKLPTAHGPMFRSPSGRPLNSHNWRERKWNPAVARLFGGTALEELTPHDLRHTAASLAIDAGADALKVANMLGHADASITYKIYIHKFEARANDVADKMAEGRRQARVRRSRTI
jgi:integrase